ncbi:MAG: ferredoxin [Phycisphaeraceae bacterium]|nr:ferredoxin [Phycisphaeraceae bacterium]
MERINKDEYAKRIDRITNIFSKIAVHADTQAQIRCPYKNRFDQCTAKFGCQNKRKPHTPGELPGCASDDKLDYRTAWESEPESYMKVKKQIKTASATRSRSKPTRCVMHDGESRPSEVGKTMFDYADELSVRVPTSCGRTGHCHECIVEIKNGGDALSPRAESEAFLSGDYRLACQAVVEKTDQDIEFTVLRRSPQILTSAVLGKTQLDPVVTRESDHVLYDGKVVDEYRGGIYGLSVDLGTTTMVAELVDLESGKSVYTTALENPQRFGGSDVMYRISYDRDEFHGELHRAIITTMNSEIRQMCRDLDINRRQIYELVIVGNSTMRDLFFDLDVQPIGQKPYKSTIEEEYLEGKRESTSLNYATRKLGLWANKNARVYGAPLIASHVGGDIVADLLAIDVESHDEVMMLVDAGTNTEVVIGHKDRLIAASCPAGPAFEGGLVTYGMPGCDGAIESIRWQDGEFKYKTIGDSDPRGLCGSGLIDLLAELRRHNLMTPKGVFADKATQFTIAPNQGITFSRRDASELAQAKAANYCGQIILMRKFGVTPDQIGALYLAGGFANYVDPASAIDIGFLAPVPTDRIKKIGNGASEGARQMLLSGTKRRSIEERIKTIEHIELETMEDFFDVFVEGCQMKPMQIPH